MGTGDVGGSTEPLLVQASPAYPVRLKVDRPVVQSRWKALLRIVLAAPALVLGFLILLGAGFLLVPMWIMVLVRGSIPRWAFDVQVAGLRFTLRAYGYLFALTDEYPAFDGDHAIRFEVDYPSKVSRWTLVVWKYITSIAHFFVLGVLGLTLLLVVPVAWIAILVSGNYPEGLHSYVAGVMRWQARVWAYLISLTDEFPSFSLQAEAGPGSSSTYTICSVVGIIAFGLYIGLFVAAAAWGGQREEVRVDYQALLAGATTGQETRAEMHGDWYELTAASDQADADFAFLTPETGHRLVTFEISIRNIERAGGEPPDEIPVRTSVLTLEDTAGDDHDPLLVTLDGRPSPGHVEFEESGTALAVFEVPAAEGPAELRYDLPSGFSFSDDTIAWLFQ